MRSGDRFGFGLCCVRGLREVDEEKVSEAH